MKDKKKNSQEIYRVRIYKDFDYPSFSIDKNNRLRDVSQKAIEEIAEELKTNNDLSVFNIEIIQILPFSLRERVQDTTNNTDYDFLIREISLQDTREKYGELDFEKNADIFDEVEKSTLSVTYKLKYEIEQFYISKIKKYTNLINEKAPN